MKVKFRPQDGTLISDLIENVIEETHGNVESGREEVEKATEYLVCCIRYFELCVVTGARYVCTYKLFALFPTEQKKEEDTSTVHTAPNHNLRSGCSYVFHIEITY